MEERAGTDDPDTDEPQDTGSMPPSEPYENSVVAVRCLRTGLDFQTSSVFKLLAIYDDGITPPVSLAPFPTEPVFCRICREGLHDDADDEQPSPAADEDAETGHDTGDKSYPGRDPAEQESSTPNRSDETEKSVVNTKGPVQPPPNYTSNQQALENPLLAPCECSGSMAFVHYMCVEQWRCRSRHPEAQNGLHCETCGGLYALPPPQARPAHMPAVDQEDWLDAMPPHVMQALRQPHIFWQVGAAVVRRRWLRPVAPVFMSPIVALYCRARRLLKKRGVARRRWACSLCRRRARWKCVRCLRSYYCSRQCQNVSWHIVHKHLCYKPSRFWWSAVVYGALTVAIFPGLLRDPLMYDLGLCFIPLSFVVLGIIGGGFAASMKKTTGMDLRGRLLEFLVVLLTFWLTWISWGLVNGFFGDPSACRGMLGGYFVTKENIAASYELNTLRKLLFKPAKTYYLMWDHLALNSWEPLRNVLCISVAVDGKEGCFEHLPNANDNFFLAEEGGERCAADILTVFWVYVVAVLSYAGTVYLKYHERERRRHGRRPLRGDIHFHQD